MKISGNTILITGGGSGIGAALAQRFAARGDTVIIAGRRREALEEAIDGHANIHAMTLDIEDSAAIGEFAKQIVAEYPALNVVIHNAGIMRFEDVGAARDLTDAEATVATNLLGPIRLTDALIDHLAAQPDAAIVTVTSGLAFVPLTVTPTYNATKAAIHSYTISLREALAGKVEVIELVPPAVRTGLTPGQESREGYMPLDEFIDEVMTQFGAQPTPAEILVDRVKPLRNAELENAFADRLAMINEFARQQREG